MDSIRVESFEKWRTLKWKALGECSNLESREHWSRELEKVVKIGDGE